MAGQPLYSSQFTRDVRDMIALGAVKGWRVVHKFGANHDLGTAVEDVWSAGGVYSYLTAAASLEVLSANAADTSAGAGARTVVVEGLGSDFVEQSETVSLSGVTPVALVKQYIRINRMYVATTGTYGIGSSGLITLRVAGAGATQTIIEQTTIDGIAWDYGQTQLARYTVPYNHIAFVSRIDLQVEDTKRADFTVFQRTDGNLLAAPYASRRIISGKPGVTGASSIIYTAPQVFAEKTDISIQARLSSGANGRVSALFEIFEGELF